MFKFRANKAAWLGNVVKNCNNLHVDNNRMFRIVYLLIQLVLLCSVNPPHHTFKHVEKSILALLNLFNLMIYVVLQLSYWNLKWHLENYCFVMSRPWAIMYGIVLQYRRIHDLNCQIKGITKWLMLFLGTSVTVNERKRRIDLF